MVMYNKQHLNNTWSWIHEKVKQHIWKKALLMKKRVIWLTLHLNQSLLIFIVTLDNVYDLNQNSGRLPGPFL